MKKKQEQNRKQNQTGTVPYRTVPDRTGPDRKPQPASQQASTELIYCVRNWSRGRFGIVFGVLSGSLFDVVEVSLAQLLNKTPESEKHLRKTPRKCKKKNARI